MTSPAADAPQPSPIESPVNRALSESLVIRALLLVALLVAGLAMWLHFGAIEWAYGAQLAGVALFAALALIPPVARPIGRALASIRHLAPRSRRVVALGIFLASAGVLVYLNFVREHSDLHPSVCDEYSYLIQAQLISRGRLWSAPHEHPEFFTTFQVIADPVYASIYFPGTALWIAPWARLAADGSLAWIGPWLAASLAVMLLYLITAELIDDLAGILAALLAFAVPIWRGLAMVIMGQCIAAMLGLLVVWLFLRWRAAARTGRTGQALAWGAAAGFVATWAMLTRPVDGLAYSLPVVIGVLAAGSVPVNLRALSMAAAIAGILPLAGMQLAFNKAVSGSSLRTPFSWYNQKYLPGTNYSADSREHERMKEIEHTAHFHLSYQTFTRPFVEDIGSEPLRELARERLRMTTVAGTTHGMTLIWVPFALLLLIPRRGLPDPDGSTDPDRPLRRPKVGGWDLWLLAAPFPLMWLLYLPYGFYLYQYAGAAVPSLAFWMAAGVVGLVALVSTWRPPAHPRGADLAAGGGDVLDYQPVAAVVRRPWWYYGALVFACGALLSLATRGIPGFYQTQSEDWYRVPELRQIDQILGDVGGPALVFVTPPGGDAPAEAEAVYNLGVVTPDDASVIRAHDLAERNIALVNYYARVQPDRQVFHYHRRTRQLTDLGNAAELSARPHGELEELFAGLSLPWRRRYAALLERHGYDAEQMPFEAPPESEWDPMADDLPPGAGIEPPATRATTGPGQ